MATFGTVSRGWKIFFWLAAIFNFLIGSAGMFVPEATIDARIVKNLRSKLEVADIIAGDDHKDWI